ncbi:hypothetical protein XI09_16875 [Bradyrhizobium sp. CCBAU 11386]|nr:ribbon-helix-helix protein, CopG family [Bradyrhizobium sp. CCBAU 11386]MDA9506277.1 hypothetical protein [Bradyrhizobium sp. CCBAU 11386]
MKKSIKVAPKKRGRPPSGGRDPGVHIRLPEAMIAAIDARALTDGTTRSEAIRRLVELGLGKAAPAITVTSTAKGSADRAKELAGKTIDKLTDPAATSSDQASRKRRLVKGPEEFQSVRRDRPNRK